MKKLILPVRAKLAFTLAEVLITLAVIGIVAVMTIPSIVSRNQKTELEARFAKAYRTIMYAVNMAVAQNGPVETWEWKDSMSGEDKDKFVKTYFIPYLNVVKACYSDSSVNECAYQGEYKHLNGGNRGKLTILTPTIMLADGIILYFNAYNDCLKKKGRCFSVTIDLNGVKKPNTVGLDYHTFNFFPSGEFLPNGIYGKYNEETKTFERRSLEEIYNECSSAGSGYFCPARIIMDGFKINY